MATRPSFSPITRHSPSPESDQVEPLLEGDLAQLLAGLGFELADALLGDAQLVAELFQGLLRRAPEAEPAGEDAPLAVAQAAEQALDRLLMAPVVALVFALIGPGVGGGLEHLLVAGDEPVAAVILLRDRPDEVPHDRP